MVKIKLIQNFAENTDTQRYSLYESMINQSEKLCLVDEEEGELPDVVVYFDTELLNLDNNDAVVELLEYKEEETPIAILDVSKDLYDCEKQGSLQTLITVCAGFVVCSNEELQEIVYTNTGRLAHIVDTPLSEDVFDSPDSSVNLHDPAILWFGLAKEIFTVKKDQVKLEKDFNIKLQIIEPSTPLKLINRVFNKTDLVYLPETFDEEGEENRETKAFLSVIKGKFVIAPNLSEGRFTYDGTLEQGVEYFRRTDIVEWIKLRQAGMLAVYGLSKSVEQLEEAVSVAPSDHFFDNVDYFLTNEEILI